jgi:hypothetical protein
VGHGKGVITEYRRTGAITERRAYPISPPPSRSRVTLLRHFTRRFHRKHVGAFIAHCHQGMSGYMTPPAAFIDHAK